MAASALPGLPAPHQELVKHIAKHPERAMVDIMAPYRKHEARLRELYAQDRQNPLLDDPYINVLPLFTDDTKLITTRARSLSTESAEEMSKYVMALPDEKRRPHEAPATVSDLVEFQHNFNVFSESSLVEMDWSNVVAAGSSVVNCLLPVPSHFKASKRKLREYYHEKFCPASDLDLFLYDLTHEQAIEKIKHIEQAVRDAILNEVTVVRTKYAITIASQYPVRHVQIVLRVYKSVSEILTGFDIDAAGAAYDGKQVYVTPRALGSFITQINHVDLTRRSPSYENRLSKYSHRNFEVYWPDLDRSRIDPTIFERSFRRTLGLARLLVLERLPTNSAREAYLNKRRMERGRPTKFQNRYSLRGNIKDSHEDEIADWQPEDDVSNYNTFTVPYGKMFHAKRIEKLCYTRDLLLNAEWNQPKDRKVHLHRHPAFFGRVQDVIEDCCGFCPTPVTPEEVEIAEKEAQVYVSGNVFFLIDDPGRQQIGSFNPLTDQDWTDMAYVGNTARLCQSIVDGDIDDVLGWLSQEGADPNKRDYTGRTPLHLAVMVSTPRIVKCLVEHGARLTARLADGKTALHLAASRGNVEIIRILMAKSIENEEAEEERDRAQENGEARDDADCSQDSDGELTEVEKGDASHGDDDVIVTDDSADEPDYYHIDVLAWDIPCSPLHLAIVEAREDAVKVLYNYGADVILPVKFLGSGSIDTAATLTLTLALTLPREQAKSMARLLLRLGATSSQADSNGYTALQRYIDSGKNEMIDTLLDEDKVGVKTALNHLTFSPHSWNPQTNSPIHSAVENGDSLLVLKLLNAGAFPHIDFDTWSKSAKLSTLRSSLGDLEGSRRKYQQSMEQPLITAVRSGNTSAAIKLLDSGADPNTLTSESQCLLTDEYMCSYTKGTSALDLVRDLIQELSNYKGEKPFMCEPRLQPGTDEFLQKMKPGTYQQWVVSADVKSIREAFERDAAIYRAEVKRTETSWGIDEKREAIAEALSGLEKLESALVAKGGKVFVELYPDIDTEKRTSASCDRETEMSNKYEFEFRFTYDSDMNETRRGQYIDLMEAAWIGDLSRIKALTLEACGPENNKPPLKIAITDNFGNSPFSLAFLQGPQDVAQAILEIVEAQWSLPEGEQVRFRIGNDDDDEEYDDEGSDGNPRLVPEKMNRSFTIEDIGKVSMLVESHVKPLEVLCSSAPSFLTDKGEIVKEFDSRSMFMHALDTDDVSRLQFLLDMVQRFSGQRFAGVEEESSEMFTLPESDFTWALANGKTQLLGLLIKSAGAGIPLDDLVKKSGVEIKQKPRYYQGLTVYGVKRRSWATAGRNMATGTTGLKTPPLLHASLGGSLEGVEFFLSDTPHRLYSEFGKSQIARQDSRLRHLEEGPGGLDRTIARWLGADNDLVIHCAILSESTAESRVLLEYLVRARPESIEKKTTEGETPLMLACRLGRVAHIKVLLDADADQSTRNKKGENLLHAALWGNPTAAKVKHLLDMFDADLRRHLFKQRKSLGENGTTPLHSWISQVCGMDAAVDSLRGFPCSIQFALPPNAYRSRGLVVEMAKLLLDYSGGEELDMLNGAGETCLHTAVKSEMISLVKVLVDFEPQLLLRENAVGRTPAELAHDQLQNQIFERPTPQYSNNQQNKLQELPGKSPGDFVDKAMFRSRSIRELRSGTESLGLSGDYGVDAVGPISFALGRGEGWPGSYLSSADLKRITWDLCSTALAKRPGKRRLVSLNEANDVARRLGERHTGSRYFSVRPRNDNDDNRSQDGKDDDDTRDFVVRTLPSRLNLAWKFSPFEREMLGMPEHDTAESEGRPE
ncbi:ankyrin repeats (3 copies) domain-containing protein [Hirsutella rhossiliensis]|uniref:Ankyrin repeats (3 copies) domain-containing protein n=1 Tax=Hirsutella rhossiliensis TaxID=111463 RepID=A0A9P8MXD4_9HYPO|nr:ankyrin repeats (3 copies) domain-containing protein [Hirsutella rhossiliensis]KAH0960912.1 ankyrin repeats (3 copies) domain-containing protein [Hirsutella rhossiliensis]